MLTKSLLVLSTLTYTLTANILPQHIMSNPSDSSDLTALALPSNSDEVGKSPSYTHILGSSGKQEYVDDYDLLNLLHAFLYPVQVDQAKAYTDAENHLGDWQAWEASTVETYVQSKVKTHDLPKDSSLDSIIKRNAYRAKVAGVYRGNARW